MLDRKFAQEFAQNWINLINTRDLDGALQLYSDAIEVTSPGIEHFLGIPDGKIRSKEQLRSYWELGLKNHPDGKLELLSILTGMTSLAVQYRGISGYLSLSFLELDENNRILGETSHL